jgi:hypothetical protein
MIIVSKAFTIFRNKACVEIQINFILFQLTTTEYFEFED